MNSPKPLWCLPFTFRSHHPPPLFSLVSVRLPVIPYSLQSKCLITLHNKLKKTDKTFITRLEANWNMIQCVCFIELINTHKHYKMGSFYSSSTIGARMLVSWKPLVLKLMCCRLQYLLKFQSENLVTITRRVANSFSIWEHSVQTDFRLNLAPLAVVTIVSPFATFAEAFKSV